MSQKLKSLTCNVSKTTNILQSIIEQKLFRKKFLTILPFVMILCGPCRELQVRALKLTCKDITITVRNFWTYVEQEMFNITGPFLWFQTEGAGPLDKGSRRFQSIWRIHLKLHSWLLGSEGSLTCHNCCDTGLAL